LTFITEFHNGFSEQETKFFPANNDVYFFWGGRGGIFIHIVLKIYDIKKIFHRTFLKLCDPEIYIYFLSLTPCILIKATTAHGVLITED
jgi:hypothetical protein